MRLTHKTVRSASARGIWFELDGRSRLALIVGKRSTWRYAFERAPGICVALLGPFAVVILK